MPYIVCDIANYATRLGKSGFIKVLYKTIYRIIHFCTLLNVQILHLGLHFLQIIFVIFQNLRWSITRARIRPTSLFQAILLSSLWSAWISILMKAWWKLTKFDFLPLLPDPFCLRPRFFGFAGNAVFVPLSEDKYPDCRGIILTDGIVVGFCIDCINALNNVLQRFACG